jgi:NodT family efflux transporter outer membrane factor (OMF) lipoprotein
VNALRRSSLVLVAAALFAAGCASTHDLKPASTMHRADQLASAQSLSTATVNNEAWPSDAWWAAFGDPQLDELEREALAGSPTLQAAAARTRIALAAAGVADANRYPAVNADASVTRERYPANALIPPPYAGHWSTYSVLEATLSWELDLWGSNRAAYQAAIGESRAAGADSYAARLALSAAVAETYFELSRGYAQLDVARAALQQREQILELTRQRNAAGLDSRLELRQTETTLPVTREEIAQLEENIARTRNALAALLGAGPDRGLAIARPTPGAAPDLNLPSLLPADLIGRRPDIAARRWRAEAAAKRIDSARADFYPNVNLNAVAGFQLLGTGPVLAAPNRELGAGPALSLPLFDAGRRRSALAGRDAEYDVAVNEYNQALADALREVADTIAAAHSIRIQRAEESLALSTARDAYELAVLRYREGVGNYLQVLTTETELLRQQSLDADLQARALVNSVDLTRALGGGYQADEPRSALTR